MGRVVLGPAGSTIQRIAIVPAPVCGISYRPGRMIAVMNPRSRRLIVSLVLLLVVLAAVVGGALSGLDLLTP